MMAKKALFIDRDGTIIKEPPVTQQVDSLDQLEFVPGAIGALSFIAKNFNYELVLVTNQDGLGTSSFPEESFWPAQELMLKTLAGEGVRFDDVFIDRSFPGENLPTRKPGTAMLKKYLGGEYDLSQSVVIGDRETDVQLAQNLGARSVRLLAESGVDNGADDETAASFAAQSWPEIVRYLTALERTVSVERVTSETNIALTLNLWAQAPVSINTGLGFFDHMLEQICKHGGIGMNLQVKGDLHVDEHHTIEDTAIVLGEALRKALGNKAGINRYGFTLPMDESLATVAVDLSGRSYLVWQAEFKREKVGDFPTELFEHFFRSLSDAARMTLHIKAEGANEHHKIECIFKAFARALRQAISIGDSVGVVPSTKGNL